MPLRDRAAQFAPFAALSGYEEAVEETARLTDSRPEPDEDTAAALNEALLRLSDELSGRPCVRISYFVPDSRKDGGAVLERSGNVRRIDRVNALMIFSDGTAIPLGDILKIEELSVYEG